MHAYAQKLALESKLGRAQDLLNSALQVWYRDDRLWQLIGYVYEA